MGVVYLRLINAALIIYTVNRYSFCAEDIGHAIAVYIP